MVAVATWFSRTHDLGLRAPDDLRAAVVAADVPEGLEAPQLGQRDVEVVPVMASTGVKGHQLAHIRRDERVAHSRVGQGLDAHRCCPSMF